MLDDEGSVGAGGSKTSSITIPVIVRPTNHAPTISMPGALGVEEDSLLSLAGIVVSDADPRDSVAIKINVSSGGLIQLPAAQFDRYSTTLRKYHQQRHVLGVSSS